MQRILLVRHAQASGDDDQDPALSELGVRQATALAERLAGEDVREVLHGPKRRARETAHYVARAAGCSPIQSDLLDDRTPVPSTERLGEYPEFRWDWLSEVPGAERDEDAAALALAWSRLLEPDAESSHEKNEGTLVLVSHAFVLAWFVARALSAPPSAWMLLPVANASITELVRTSHGELALASFNDVGHLA